MHYLALTTGSCGNCYIFTTGTDTLIIDAGVTLKKITETLRSNYIDPSTVRALLLTHLHPDHSRGVGALQRKLKIPVYISKESREANEALMIRQKIELGMLCTFDFGVPFSLPGFDIIAFPTSHDSTGSAGYSFRAEGHGYFLMTDTGCIPEGAWELSEKASIKFIESNYDEDMLESGEYPEFLKARISGSRGHLSNSAAADFAKRTSHDGDRLYFVHLSANNNTPEKVREVMEREIPESIECRVCMRGEPVEGFIS